jgi:hypothetical protein
VQPVKAATIHRDADSRRHADGSAAVEELQVRVDVLDCSFLRVAAYAVDRRGAEKRLREHRKYREKWITRKQTVHKRQFLWKACGYGFRTIARLFSTCYHPITSVKRSATSVSVAAERPNRRSGAVGSSTRGPDVRASVSEYVESRGGFASAVLAFAGRVTCLKKRLQVRSLEACPFKVDEEERGTASTSRINDNALKGSCDQVKRLVCSDAGH